MNSSLKKIRAKAISLAAAGIVTLTAFLLPAAAAYADAPPAAPSMSIDCTVSGDGNIQQTRTVAIGESFDVDAWVSLESGFESAGAAAQLTWDPAVLECTAATIGSAAPYLFPSPPFSLAVAFNLTTPGQTNNTGPSSSSATAQGSGVMARYTFHAIGAGSTNINIVGASVSDPSGESPILQGSGLNVQGGSITVAQPRPDLIVTQQYAEWINPDAGTYQVKFVVKNQGAADITSSWITGVYPDSDPDITPAAGSVTLGNLAAGASTPVQTVGPITMTGGTDTIIVFADSNEDITEENETNNTMTSIFAAYAMTVNAPTNADLYSTFNVDVEVTVPSGFVSSGAAAALSFDQNKLECKSVTVGSGAPYKYPVPPSLVVGPLAELPTIANGGINNTTGQVAITGLLYLPGDSSTNKVFMRYEFKAKAAGVAAISLITPSLSDDVGNPITEPDLNVYNDSVNITASTLPDLTIENLNETWVDQGSGTYNISFTVKNIGGGTATAHEANQCGILIDGAFITLAQFPNNLVGGASANITKGPFTLSDGSDEITVIADYIMDITESNENNNTATDLFGLPDIVVNYKAETWISDGVSYRVNFTVENIGDLAAPEFIVSVSNGDPAQTKNVTVTGGLAAGQKKTYTAVGPFNLVGIYDIITITADSTGLVVESNEGNNIKTNLISYESDSDTTDINGNVMADIELTSPSDIDSWHLTIGINTASGTLNIKSNVPWQVDVSDADSISNGFMTEWNGSTFADNPEKLNHAMIIKCGSFTVILAGPGMICEGDTDGQNGNLGENFQITFSQEVEWADAMLTNGNVYYICVTFNAGVVF
ncbi:MAG: CARDB domain-containing protein [Dehalococcoidales bacterium]